ncbi:MAG: nitronate monooxygenase [Candidatus Helarchaeota archaeon]|nr:nitronate monooxygenase [Candidatus Helarchaeota archaeon]
MKWVTKITKMVNCRFPIILGAFAGHDDTQLTAAVSKAGGFGILTASFFPGEEQFRKAILEIKKITKNPFGVNFSVDKEITPAHPFYRYLEILNEEGIKTIITAAYKVDAFGKKAKEYGMNWIHKATVMKHALKGVTMGADAIILTGLEGGGLKNPKQNTLLINMVNAHKIVNVPFIASGGISDGRGMLGALILGAQAVHLCTAFLATKESPIPDVWKQQLIDANCFDPKIIKKVYHFESNSPKYVPLSMAVGTINEIISVEDLIKKMIDEGEAILNSLGFQEDTINFIR